MLPRDGQLYGLANVFAGKHEGVCLCVCVRSRVRTRSIKSDFGPGWCETKCRSSIRIKSPYVLWDPALPRWCTAGQACVWWLMAFVFSSSFSLSPLHTHTHRAYSDVTFAWPTQKGWWADVPSRNNTIRNLLLPQDRERPLSECVCHFFTIQCTVLILTWLSKQSRGTI